MRYPGWKGVVISTSAYEIGVVLDSRCTGQIDMLTSRMCCWNMLPGPSLSSDTCTTIVRCIAGWMHSTYNELVALRLKPVTDAKLRFPLVSADWEQTNEEQTCLVLNRTQETLLFLGS